MPLCSMTGFARADGTGEGYRWTWEVRSVNGKGLDIRLRLPAGFDVIEPAARGRIGVHLVRGSVQASLTAQHDAGTTQTFSEDVRPLADPQAQMVLVAKRGPGREHHALLGREPVREHE